MDYTRTLGESLSISTLISLFPITYTNQITRYDNHFNALVNSSYLHYLYILYVLYPRLLIIYIAVP